MTAKKTYTKTNLVAEVAEITGLSKVAVTHVFEQLTRIAYREAEHGFVIPGLCKIKVVKKKASRHRNPVTGKLLLIGERLALKMLPLKKAKTAITPNKDVTVQEIDDLAPLDIRDSGAPAGSPPLPPPAAPAAGAGIAESEDGQLIFPCPDCGNMIAAPPKSAGLKGECPFCKAMLTIPARPANVRLDGSSAKGKPDEKAAAAKASPSAVKPKVDLSSMTIRIDLSDLQ